MRIPRFAFTPKSTIPTLFCMFRITLFRSLSDHSRARRVKGITDPRSLPDPGPPTEVDRAGAGRSETSGAQATPNVRQLLLYIWLYVLRVYAVTCAAKHRRNIGLSRREIVFPIGIAFR